MNEHQPQSASKAQTETPTSSNTADTLALFVNASAGAGEVDELLRLWDEKVPATRQGAVFAVRDTAHYDSELDRALAFCETSGSTLVVAGGDGTFNGVLTRPASRRVTLALIPTGTFNFFARSHGIPEDLDEAIEAILGGAPVKLPLAHVNDRPFIVSVSIGVHPTMIAEREANTRYMGRTRLGAWISGIWTILRARHLTQVGLETESWSKNIVTPLVLVNFNSAQLIGMDDRFQYRPERLTLLRLGKTSHRGIIAFIFRAVSGRVLDEDTLECDHVSRVSITTPRARERVALDGELVECTTPMQFRVEKEAFTCLLQGSPV